MFRRYIAYILSIITLIFAINLSAFSTVYAATTTINLDVKLVVINDTTTLSVSGIEKPLEEQEVTINKHKWDNGGLFGIGAGWKTIEIKKEKTKSGSIKTTISDDAPKAGSVYYTLDVVSENKYFKVVNNDLWGDTTKASLEIYAGNISSFNGTPYKWIVNLNSANNTGVFYILATLTQGIEKLKKDLGASAPPIDKEYNKFKVVYNKKIDSSYFDEFMRDALYIRNTAVYEDSVLLHELGHSVMAYFFGSPPSSGGDHSSGKIFKNSTLPLSEGWATFFQSSVTGNSLYESWGGSTRDNLEDEWDSIRNSNLRCYNNEVTVAKGLWDYYDSSSHANSSNEPYISTSTLNMSDNLSVDYSKIYDVFSNYKIDHSWTTNSSLWTMTDFWKGWLARQAKTESQRMDAWQIMQFNGNKDPRSPYDYEVPTLTSGFSIYINGVLSSGALNLAKDQAVTIKVNDVKDNIGVQAVAVYVDGETSPRAIDNSRPFELSFNLGSPSSITKGNHNFYIRAFDPAGNYFKANGYNKITYYEFDEKGNMDLKNEKKDGGDAILLGSGYEGTKKERKLYAEKVVPFTITDSTYKYAVTTPSTGWGDIGTILTNKKRSYDSLKEQDLFNKSNSSAYILNRKVLVLNSTPASATYGRLYKDDIKEFVENGGVLYATDWSINYLKDAFPSYIGLEENKFPVPAQKLDVKLISSGLKAKYLGGYIPGVSNNPVPTSTDTSLGGMPLIKLNSSSVTVEAQCSPVFMDMKDDLYNKYIDNGIDTSILPGIISTLKSKYENLKTEYTESITLLNSIVSTLDQYIKNISNTALKQKAEKIKTEAQNLITNINASKPKIEEIINKLNSLNSNINIYKNYTGIESTIRSQMDELISSRYNADIESYKRVYNRYSILKGLIDTLPIKTDKISGLISEIEQKNKNINTFIQAYSSINTQYSEYSSMLKNLKAAQVNPTGSTNASNILSDRKALILPSPIDNVATSTGTITKGYSKKDNVPLLVTFNYGKGKVIYNSLPFASSNSVYNTINEYALSLIDYSVKSSTVVAASMDEDSNINDDPICRETTDIGLVFDEISTGDKKEYNIDLEVVKDINLEVSWDEGTFLAELINPLGQVIKTDEASDGKIFIQQESAMAGRWLIRITPVALLMENYPFRIDIYKVNSIPEISNIVMDGYKAAISGKAPGMGIVKITAQGVEYIADVIEGQFKLENVILTEGLNDMKITGTTLEGQSTREGSLVQYVDNKGPKINVAIQGRDYVTEGETLKITIAENNIPLEVTTDEPAVIKVNGNTIIDLSAQVFNRWGDVILLPVKEGDNSIEIVATDEFSNRTAVIKTINITKAPDIEKPQIEVENIIPSEVYSGILPIEYNTRDNVSIKEIKVFVDDQCVAVIQGNNNQELKGTYNLDTTLIKNGPHDIAVVVYDSSGNYNYNGLYVKTKNIKFKWQNPLDTKSEFGLNQNISIHFYLEDYFGKPYLSDSIEVVLSDGANNYTMKDISNGQKYIKTQGGKYICSFKPKEYGLKTGKYYIKVFDEEQLINLKEILLK